MLRQLLLLALLGTTAISLSSCGDGNPFFEPDSDNDGIPDSEDDDDDAAGGDNPGDPLDTGNEVLDTGIVRPPAGTTPLPADGSLRRAEAEGEGGGLVSSVVYVPATATTPERFIVDGLGFDGENTYSRGSPVGQLGSDTGGYAVYEADVVVSDPLTGNPIAQVAPYRAIYGVSSNNVSATDARPRTSFAIVRTGGYVGYGFGGFLYARNGTVTLPDSRQAIFSGEYAGMRVFDGMGGLEYTTGDMSIAIDFRDFNANDAVQGTLTNRVAYTDAGAEIPLGTTLDDGLLLLPDVHFVIQEGAPSLLPSGEMGGNVTSYVVDGAGMAELYEEGTYYAVIAGNLTSAADGGEIVGIIVMESQDPRFDGISVQETGGFIVYR